MASARTSDHHPIPMQATRRGPALTTFVLPRALLFPAQPDRLDGRFCNAQISLPVAAADADTADAFAVSRHGHTALHGGPSFRSGSKCKTDRMAHVEVLTGGTLCRGRTPV